MNFLKLLVSWCSFGFKVFYMDFWVVYLVVIKKICDEDIDKNRIFLEYYVNCKVVMFIFLYYRNFDYELLFFFC